MTKLNITLVADPMMGLVWETWPTHRKLESHYGNQIEFSTLMGGLVPDVYELVDSQVMKKYGKTVAVNQYWARLMQIYLQEEQLAGMPIYMGGGAQLFDTEHPSSIPLNRGLRTIAGNDRQLEDRVLYEMQYDTVVNNRQTNGFDYLTSLAKKFGIDEAEFTKRYQSDGLIDELQQEKTLIKQMKVDQLPTYLVSYDNQTYLIKGVPRYEQWQDLINKVTNGKITEQSVKFTRDAIESFLNRHPHTSSLELKEAFDLEGEQFVIDALKDSSLEQTQVKSTVFYRQK